MYPTKRASMAARRMGARMTNLMTAQGTTQISANTGKAQTWSTIPSFALPNGEAQRRPCNGRPLQRFVILSFSSGIAIRC